MSILSEHESSTEPATKFVGSWIRPLVAVFWLAAVIAVLNVDIGTFRTWLRSTGSWAPVAFVLISTILMSILVPKTVVSLSAGALFGTMLGSSLMVIIGTLAAASNYAIGRWWMQAWVQKKLHQTEQPSASHPLVWMRVMTEIAGQAGFGLHLLIRLSPVPTMLISYAMGAAKARLSPYLWAAAIAIIPQVLWVHSGSAATLIHDPDASALRWISAGSSILVAILVSVIISRQAVQRLRESTGVDHPATRNSSLHHVE